MTLRTKLLFLLITLAFILEPHFIDGHILAIPRTYALSVGQMVLLGLLYLVYSLYRRDLRKKESEKQRLEQAMQLSSKKLNDAFAYIGQVNRYVPLLKNVSSDLLRDIGAGQEAKKKILTDLLATAVTSLAQTAWGVFRFIEMTSCKTLTEIKYSTLFHNSIKNQPRNEKIIGSREQDSMYGQVGDTRIFFTSDRQAGIQCVLLLPKDERDKRETEALLQSIVDQAQLFYKYLRVEDKMDRPASKAQEKSDGYALTNHKPA